MGRVRLEQREPDFNVEVHSRKEAYLSPPSISVDLPGRLAGSVQEIASQMPQRSGASRQHESDLKTDGYRDKPSDSKMIIPFNFVE